MARETGGNGLRKQAREPLDHRRGRAAEIIRVLARRYAGKGIPLDHRSPLELLVATILSAQSTDATVNRVTPHLFERFPGVENLAAAEREELEAILRPTGFFRQKARAVQETCRAILTRYGGEVPHTMDELTTLPGVGRKTANVMLAAARIDGWPGWGREPDGLGVVVDTHVRRLSRRLDLSRNWDPDRIERDLTAVIPREHWPTFPLHLIFLGREICGARRPRCSTCPLSHHCPSAAHQGESPWLRDDRPAGDG